MPSAAAPTRAPCPCCGREVVLAKQDNLKSRWGTPFDGEVSPSMAELAARGTIFSSHSNQERLALYWACNECIRSKRVIVSDPAKQKWCDCEPYLAYFDETRTCVDCAASFVFSKEEQRHWYEELQFWVWSRPIRCKTCNARRKGRHA